MFGWLQDLLAGRGSNAVESQAVVKDTLPPEPQKVTEPYKLDPYAPLPENETPWKAVALKEQGQAEIPGPQDNPRILEYHAATKLHAESELVSWCSAFMCWVMKESGFQNPATAWARDWLNYGKKLSAPIPWCILVLERNAPGGDSHVTLWTGKRRNGLVECFGGNQHDMVCFSWFPEKDILGYRWPVKA